MKGIFEVEAIRGEVLGIKVFRGFAKLSDLARISQPDVYDQEKNPTGNQRDLNRRHAREAYQYVKTRSLAFYPEIVLHARDESVLEFTPLDGSLPNVGKLTVNLDRIAELGGVVLSRVDGNHRLYYADGHDPGFPPLDEIVGFCIMYGLPVAEGGVSKGELLLFRDINANQRGMNTSHLDSIDLRTAEKGLETRDPILYIAERLMEDDDSPFHGRVYRGGVRPADFMIPLRNVKTSVQYMRQRSKKLKQFSPDVQAKLMKRYWQAVKRWVPDAWQNPGRYVALRATGFWAMSFIGSDVIDDAVTSGKLETEDMLAILQSGKDWDWSNSGNFRGYGGRDGATEIANMVTKEFVSEGLSISEIEARLRQ
jgi:DGQHR domain-containing protein